MRTTKHPAFVRQNRHHKRISLPWRKPRGIDNKQRVMQGGSGKLPRIGYRVPRKLRFLVHGGKSVILAHTVSEIERADGASVIRIGGTVGARKRILLIAAAKKRNLRVLNA